MKLKANFQLGNLERQIPQNNIEQKLYLKILFYLIINFLQRKARINKRTSQRKIFVWKVDEARKTFEQLPYELIKKQKTNEEGLD